MNLYLIGYRGSGKSTVAPLVAQRLGWSVADTDDDVEARSKLSIAEIFSQHGEAEFRQRESRSLTEWSNRENHVISLGGGAPMSPDNRKQMEHSGKTVWLKADATSLWQRIQGDKATTDRRPDLTQQGGRAEVESLLVQRNPVYEACADYTIEIGSLTPQEIADRIVNWFETVDK